MSVASSYDANFKEIQVLLKGITSPLRVLAPINQETPNFTIRSIGAIPWSCFMAHFES
jgi:hypothetical protein